MVWENKDRKRAKPNPMMRRRELGMHCAGVGSGFKEESPAEIGRGALDEAGSAEG